MNRERAQVGRSLRFIMKGGNKDVASFCPGEGRAAVLLTLIYLFIYSER